MGRQDIGRTCKCPRRERQDHEGEGVTGNPEEHSPGFRVAEENDGPHVAARALDPDPVPVEAAVI
jgi:hypothetical protein